MSVDPDTGDVLTVTAPALPAWLALTDNGDGTAMLAGTPESGDIGPHAVTLRVTDVTGALQLQSFTITVSSVPSTMLADMDFDGDVDFDDIDDFVLALTDGAAYTSRFGVPPELHGDTDQDGDIDFDDIDFDDIDDFIDLLIDGFRLNASQTTAAPAVAAAALAETPQAVDRVFGQPWRAVDLAAVWSDDQDWLGPLRWSRFRSR